MRQHNLIESPVIFNAEEHSYTLNGQSLQGVTPIIAWLFPETYRGIPKEVLAAAACHGKMIHEKAELADSMGIVDDPIIEAYIAIQKEAGCKTLVSEYLVSDEHRIASAIDKVMDNGDLWDIKATSKVHINNVTMQLSIYAWLYERQNVNVKAGRLFCCWLPKEQYGKPKLIECSRVPSEVCAEVVEIWANGGDVLNARALIGQYLDVSTEIEMSDEVKAMVEELVAVKKSLNQLERREAEIKDTLLSMMRESGERKIANDMIQITRKESYERVGLNVETLKKENPEIFEKYKKVSVVKESLTYKVL